MDVNFRLVYPLAIRKPSFFKNKNMLTYFFWRLLDYRKVANRHEMPFFRPKPDPIVQNILTGKISPEQPYICLLYTSPSPRDRTRSRMPSSA